MFVGNLPRSCKETDLRNRFSEFGVVDSVRLPQGNGRSLGHGFVRFATPGAACLACREADRISIGGRHVTVVRCEMDSQPGLLRREQSSCSSTPGASLTPGTRRRSGSSLPSLATSLQVRRVVSMSGTTTSETLYGSAMFEGEELGKATAKVRRALAALGTSKWLFMFAHGCHIVFEAWAHAEEPQPFRVRILPVLLGGLSSACLIVMFWLLSLPYFRMCTEVALVRIGRTGPSILTELLPRLLTSVVYLLLGVAILIAEALALLEMQRAVLQQPYSFAAPGSMFLIIGAALGGSSVVMFGEGTALALLGALFAGCGGLLLGLRDGPAGSRRWMFTLSCLLFVLGLCVRGAVRLQRVARVLTDQELLLREVEAGMLFFMAVSLCTLMAGQLEMAEEVQLAREAGVAFGVLVCATSLVNAKLVQLESRVQPVEERLTTYLCLQGQHARLQHQAPLL